MTNQRPAAEPDSQPAGRRSLNGGRLFGLGALLFVVAISVAIPAQQLIEQQARLADLKAQLAQNQQRIAQLQAEVDRWGDPAYVKAQARDRLHYVMPNEVGYIVLEAEEAPAVAPVVRPKSSSPWYRVLWQSMHDAAKTSSPKAANE